MSWSYEHNSYFVQVRAKSKWKYTQSISEVMIFHKKFKCGFFVDWYDFSDFLHGLAFLSLEKFTVSPNIGEATHKKISQNYEHIVIFFTVLHVWCGRRKLPRGSTIPQSSLRSSLLKITSCKETSAYKEDFNITEEKNKLAEQFPFPNNMLLIINDKLNL